MEALTVDLNVDYNILISSKDNAWILGALASVLNNGSFLFFFFFNSETPMSLIRDEYGGDCWLIKER